MTVRRKHLKILILPSMMIFCHHRDGDDFKKVPWKEPHESPHQATKNISYNGVQYKKVTAQLFLLLFITNV